MKLRISILFALLVAFLTGSAQFSPRNVVKGGVELHPTQYVTLEYERALGYHFSALGSIGGIFAIAEPPQFRDNFRVDLEARYYFLFRKRYETEGLYFGGTARYWRFIGYRTGTPNRTSWEFMEFGGVLGGQVHILPQLTLDGNVFYGRIPADNAPITKFFPFQKTSGWEGQMIGASLMIGYAF